MVRVLFKQEKYRFENTLNKLCIQDKIFHLTDKDVVELLNQIETQRPDLFEETKKVSSMQSSYDTLKEEYKELEEENDSLVSENLDLENQLLELYGED
jgi:chromosome segregation ATPase